MPNTENNYFFEDQKSIFDGFSHQYFSYSAPTSLGKSYVIIVFIKQQILKNERRNFAVIVPTKALINEFRTKMLGELGQTLMQEKNYKIVVSANDLVLDKKHNFIYIMTPERFLYLINTTSNQVDYLFIDEAHKISTKDSRSPFYYELVDKVSNMNPKPHVVFSAPNIPNPEEYLKLIPYNDNKSKQRSTFAPVSQIKYLIDLKDGVVKVYNDYSKNFIKMGNATRKLNLTMLINHVSTQETQNIVYCNSVHETIDQAVEYSKNCSTNFTKTQKIELEKLSNEVKNKIHADYFLVDLIKKGVAFHVGYLPTGIRKRIEDAFKNHIIKTLFCTSTLIEGVNLPADNLFITSYKNGRSNLDDVSFRNLVGRVGRIDHNLFGNVFMVCLANSDDKTVDNYQKLLTNDIPNQKLSIDASLTLPQKKAIITGLVNNDFEMKTKKYTSDTEFSIMRKKALIFINDLRNGNESLIVKQLKQIATEEQLELIKENIKQIEPYDSIEVSPDQFKNLQDFVSAGKTYPDLLPNGNVDYTSAVNFLRELAKVFKWRVYEQNTLGFVDKTASKLSRIPWYSNILYKWMSGYGLNSIIYGSIQYKEKHPDTGIWVNNWKIEDRYDKDNPRHKNLVIADTLNTIENVILFSVANYFREFSTEYKKQHNYTAFDNDWYEYVEYGTTNPLTIVLQRYGYSRESSSYIISHKDDFVDFSIQTDAAPFALRKNELLNCSDEGVSFETVEIAINIPELFIDEEE